MGIGASLTLFFLLKEGLAYSVLSGLIPSASARPSSPSLS